MTRPRDLTGLRFGRLVVTERGPANKWRQPQWRCLCGCGVQTLVPTASLLRGTTQSCGCLRVERAARANTTHGHAMVGREHPLYHTWENMHARCTNPRATMFHRYGGRGISVCARWRDFASFLADMGEKPSPRHTLDRINNDGNYEPANVRWATRKEQAANRRRNGGG